MTQAKSLLVILSLPWCLLWLLVSLLELAVYLHDPAVPHWRAIALVTSSVLVAAALSTVLAQVNGDGRWSLEQPRDWLLRSLRWLPAFWALAVALTYGLRELVCLAAGGHYHPTPSDLRPLYQIVKLSLFYALWLALAFAARTYRDWKQQRLTPKVDARRRGTSGHLLVPVGDRQRLLAVADILWLQADGNYVRLHTVSQDYALRRTLRDLLGELGEDRFVRIHRSRAVNIAEIGTISSLAGGDAEILLNNGTRLRMSRRFRLNWPETARA